MGRISEAVSSAVGAVLSPGQGIDSETIAERPTSEAFDEITLTEFFMGRDVAYAALLTDELRANARETCRRWNLLLRAFFDATGINHRGVRSGWRPPAVNAITLGAAPDSTHMRCMALDVEDPFKDLAAFVVANPELVSAIGLWFEDPLAKEPKSGALYTPDWVHGQTVPPRSGRRFYIPF